MNAQKLKSGVSTITIAWLGLFSIAGYRNYSDLYLQPLEVEIAAVGQTTSDGVKWIGSDLEDNQPMPEGARFQVNFRVARPCYAYLLHVDRKGSVKILYKRDAISGKLEPGPVYTLPSPSLWYTVSDLKDRELISLVVSARPLTLPELKGLEKEQPGSRKSELVAVPLSDTSIHQTHWKLYQGKGIIVRSWEFNEIGN